MATYQNLGYFENNGLTILSPVRKIEQFGVTFDKEGEAVETPLKKNKQELVRKAQAYYQYTNMYLKR